MTKQHRHEWIHDVQLCDLRGTFVCSECGATTAECNTCGDPVTTSANLICQRCLDREREVLTHIGEAWKEIGPDKVEILQLGTIDHDARTRRPTVDHPDQVSVPLGAGGLDSPDDFEELYGILRADPSRSLLQLLHDPANIIDALHEVAEDWAGQRGVTASGNVLTWLGENLLWAAQTLPDDAWLDYRRLARHVRHRIRHVAGLLPERDPIPCLHCGAADTVVQDWIDKHGRPYPTGLSDTLRCMACGYVWDDRAHFDYVNLTTVRAAPVRYPDAKVSLAEARAALPRARRNTINVAIHRDRKRPADQRRIPEVGRDRRGEPLYRLGDIAAALGLDGNVRDGQGSVA